MRHEHNLLLLPDEGVERHGPSKQQEHMHHQAILEYYEIMVKKYICKQLPNVSV